MTYQDELEITITATAAQVRATLTLYEAGALTVDELASTVASYVAAGNSAAAALADLSLAAALTVSAGEVVAPLGITRPADDPDRLAKAAATLLSLDSASPERWERLARAEGQEAAARAAPP